MNGRELYSGINESYATDARVDGRLGCAVKAAPSLLNETVDELAHSVEVMRQGLDDLRVRLTPIRNTVPRLTTTNGFNDGAKDGAGSPLVDSLRSIGRDVGETHRGLLDLMSELDI